MKRPFSERPPGARPDSRSAGPKRPFGDDAGKPDRKPSGKSSGKTSGKPAPKPVALSPGFLSRRAALDVLTLVRAGSTLEEALDRCRSFAALEGSDRGFARLLATTVLRRQGALDAVIGAYIDRPLPKRAAKATDMLRLAAAQSILLDTPDHAAVSTAVDLAGAFQETAGYAGLVNAVARKIAAEGKAAAAALPERIDTPGWMWRAWERAYGPAAARAIAAAHRREAPLDLTSKDPAAAAALAATLGARLLPTGSVRLETGADVAALPGYAEGAWWVQDAAAALPARLLGDLAGKRALDLCAAPGGKTMQLASAGADVTAVDIAGERLKRVADNLARTGLRAATVKADIRDWTPAAQWPAILLDAPCSATGTIRRHPDILWSKREEDIAALTALQAACLDKAAALLEPGGVLVYAVCSLQKEEGEQQIEAALQRHPDLKRSPVAAAELGAPAEAITRAGDLRTLPSMMAGEGGLDGFYAARLIKSA